MTPAEVIAIVFVVVGGALVIVGSFVKTMIPLRWLAVGSNAGFIIYGALHPSLPMLLLNATLLPINVVRAVQMVRLTRRVTQVSESSHLSGLWLKPYMRSARLRAGEIIFHQGDQAERFYLLAQGKVEFVEIAEIVGPGSMFGEIAFFSPRKERRLTARCVEDCILLSIDESTMKQLYFQNPAFGFELLELVAGRLVADVERLRGQNEQLVASASGQDRAAVAARN